MPVQESTLASFTRPDPDAPDHPLGLIRTLERAQEVLEAGEIPDTRAAIQGALEKARETQPQKAPAHPPHVIEDLVSGPDAELGHFLAEGGETARKGAIRSALTDAHALCEVLTTVDKDQALGAVNPFQWSRVAWIAANYIDRALELQGRAEGNSDE